MKHYVYRITNIKFNKHYYGTRTSKNRIPEEDIGYIYFSSSHDKEFIKDQKENPQDYKYKVIKKFNTRKKALELEIKLHNKFNVAINESFYNRSKQSSTSFDTAGIKPWNKGGSNHQEGQKRSLETKQRLSEAAKNRKITKKVIEGYKKQSIEKTGVALHDDATKKVISKASKENWKNNPNMNKCLENLRNNNPAKIKVECPHCKRMIAKTMINRWHNDNCKLKIKE